MSRKVVRLNQESQQTLDLIKNVFIMECGIKAKDSQIIETALKKYLEAVKVKADNSKQFDLSL